MVNGNKAWEYHIRAHFCLDKTTSKTTRVYTSKQFSFFVMKMSLSSIFYSFRNCIRIKWKIHSSNIYTYPIKFHQLTFFFTSETEKLTIKLNQNYPHSNLQNGCYLKKRARQIEIAQKTAFYILVYLLMSGIRVE